MPADRSVLESLLEGRSALVLEVERLTAAIAELDAVIDQIGGAGRRVSAATGADLDSIQPAMGSGTSSARMVDTRSRTSTVTRRPPAKKATPRRSSGSRAAGASAMGDAPKSIRVHVLDMLGAEDREFGLAEIIDRVHDAGIQAHDDAVRSITIKLMKDGKVERVGRGQYKLARRGSRSTVYSETVPAEEADVELEVAEGGLDELDVVDEATGAGEDAASTQTYTPPLNLGQPWEQND